MGSCRSRYFMLVVCLLQFITVIQRQVFDFLGYLYIPILLNFFQVIFVIFGSFGAYQYRPKYIITYVLWNFVWLGWNLFLICLYLDVGKLNHKENMVLKLDKESGSWWMNGPGCKSTWDGDKSVIRVDGCLLDYEHIEIFQGALQTILAVLGIISGLCLSKIFLEEDDSSSRKFASTSSTRKKKKKKNSTSSKQQRMSLYSIEFSPQNMDINDDVLDDEDTDQDDLNAGNNATQAPVSPKPMTPRRVKRRSVMQRGSSGRHSSSSTNRRSTNNNRSSTRSTGGRAIAQNPVTRILEQQQQQQQMHISYDSPSTGAESPPQHYYNNVHNGVVLGPAAHNSHQHQQRWTPPSGGHTNPTYQQSSSQSLNVPDYDMDLYNNRPASARSSYSNFHGTRPISYGGGGGSEVPAAQAHYTHSHAAAQVPFQRRGNTSIRSNKAAFLNNGPPAYSSSQQQHHNPLPPLPVAVSHSKDCETAM